MFANTISNIELKLDKERHVYLVESVQTPAYRTELQESGQQVDCHTGPLVAEHQLQEAASGRMEC